MTRDKILTIVAQRGTQTTEELMAATGFTYDKVHNSVKRLVKAGKLVRLANKAYAVTAKATFSSSVTDGLLAAGKPQKSTHKPLQAPAFAPRQPRRIVNRFIVVLDKSSSMQGIRSEALAGINNTFDQIREQAFKSGQETTISYYEFANQVERQFLNQDAQQLRRLTSYSPFGMTALFDAVEDAVRDHSVSEVVTADVAYCLIVVTDGGNNQSRDNSGKTMAEVLRRAQATDKWTVTFQLPHGHKDAFCRTFGIPQGNVMEWENTVHGNEEARASRSLGIENYTVSRAAGLKSVNNFYVKTDLSNVKPTDVKKTLKDIKSEVKVWTVPAETDIKPFIEQRSGNPYVPGTAFYELTKSEDKIQPYKKLLVMEKDHRNVYAGEQARQLLGLPTYGNVRVKPGNHSNFNVFVQSTSVNRKLVRGTQVVYWPGAVR